MNWAPKPIVGKRICHVGEAYGLIRTAWTDGAYRTALLCLRENFGTQILPFLGCELCGNNEFLSVWRGGKVQRAPIVDKLQYSPLCGNKCSLPSTDYCHNLYPRGGTPGTQYEPWGEDPSCPTLCDQAPTSSLGQLWGTCDLKKKRGLETSKRRQCYGTSAGDAFATRHCPQHYNGSRADPNLTN
jgi:hypothetical protein